MNNNAAGKQDVKPVLTPKLRFPEFRDSSGWEELPLSELVGSLDAGVSVNSGDRPANESEIGVLKTSAVTNGIFEPQENKVVFDEIEIGRVREAVSEDTIIISRMNTPALVGANAYVEKSLENIFLPDRLWAAKSKLGTSMRFVAFILGSDKGRAALSKLAKGSSGSMKNITKPDVLAFLVMAPSRAEQQRISDCLTSLDEVIAAQSQKLDALKTHKKGLMQQLFPREGETLPRLRFPEFQNAPEWEKKILGQLATYTKGFAFKSQDYRNEGVRIIRVSDLGADIIKSGNEKIYISYASINDYERYKLTSGEIIITTVGSKPELVDSAVGRGIFVYSNNEGLLNQNLLKLEILAGVNSRFLFSHINTTEYQKFIVSISRGNANQANIAVKDLMEFKLQVPGHNEQQRIADCLSSLDDLITAQSAKLEALKTHKKGLMQQLFPSLEEVEA